MKSLKLLLIVLAAIVSTESSDLLAAGGQHSKTLGVLGGYDTRNKSGEAGIFFQYGINSWLRVAPDISYVTRRKGVDALSLNLNMHFPLHIVAVKSMSFYPIAGASYTSWNYHPYTETRSADTSDDVTERINKVGVNLGAGFEVCLKPTLKLRLEGQWTGARHSSTTDISLGIGYVF